MKSYEQRTCCILKNDENRPREPFLKGWTDDSFSMPTNFCEFSRLKMSHTCSIDSLQPILSIDTVYSCR